MYGGVKPKIYVLVFVTLATEASSQFHTLAAYPYSFNRILKKTG
jgi:hypothetical protein